MLFQGVTIAPARDFIATTVKRGDYARVVLPCVGRFAAASAIVAAGVLPERLWCSDVSLFSSILGAVIDPAHGGIDSLGLDVEPVAPFIAGADSELDRAAGLLVGLRWLMLPPKNLHLAEQRREVWENRLAYRDHVAARLSQLQTLMAGARYAVADVRGELLEVDGDDTVCYVNLPGYAGGYGKQYGDAEERLGWNPAVPEYDPKERLLEAVETDALVLGYVHHGREAAPPGWLSVFAHDAGKGRVDYIVANHDVDEHRARMTNRAGGTVRRFPIYDDSEITPTSKVEFVKVNQATALYYRDLFVHRLGVTQSDRYALMLIDGRVVTALGVFRQSMLGGRRTNDMGHTYLSETFGITVTSQRYARLGKLFMLCLTSAEFREWSLRAYRELANVDEYRGILTTSITQHHEGKTDRSVMQLREREELPGGLFRLVYTADFRDDTWAECVAGWLDRWGEKARR